MEWMQTCASWNLLAIIVLIGAVANGASALLLCLVLREQRRWKRI